MTLLWKVAEKVHQNEVALTLNAFLIMLFLPFVLLVNVLILNKCVVKPLEGINMQWFFSKTKCKEMV